MKRFFTLFSLFLSTYFLSVSQQGYTVYYGNLHSHTGYTGGVEDPAYAFIYARDTGHLDFLAITDHLETLSNTEWSSTKTMADQATVNGVFVGFAGYEWTSPNYGHCNVFNTTTKASQLNVNNWNAFRQDLLANPPAIAQFNHPGFVGSNNWDNFTYIDQQTDNVFALFEINSSIQEYYYPQVLDAGWHVSPTAGQDNHDATWGTLDDTRTGVWSMQLTRDDLINSFIAGRTFSTYDKNASVWINIGTAEMGSSVDYSQNMQLHITMNDADQESWKYVTVYAAGNQQLFYMENLPYNFDTVISINPSQSKWIYVKARQVDDQYIYSAPIYITNLPTAIPLVKNDVSLSVFPNPITAKSCITISVSSSRKSTVRIFDITGKNIWNNELTLFQGINTIPVPKSLVKGIYFIEYYDEFSVKTIKIVCH